MKNITLLITLLLSSIAYGKCQTDSPELTLNCYFELLENGNSEGVMGIYYESHNFYLPKEGVKYDSVRILSREIITSDFQSSGPETPIWGKAGNIKLRVEITFNGVEEVGTYFFREIKGQWLMVGHAIDGYEEFIEDA